MKILLSGEDKLPFTHCDFQRRWRVEARRRTRPSPHRLIKTKSQYADCLGDLIYFVIARQRAANPSRTQRKPLSHLFFEYEKIVQGKATSHAQARGQNFAQHGMQKKLFVENKNSGRCA